VAVSDDLESKGLLRRVSSADLGRDANEPFEIDSLPDNRAGRLSEAQRTRLAKANSQRRTILTAAALGLPVAALVLLVFALLSPPEDRLQPAILASFAGVAWLALAPFLVRTLRTGSDIEAGIVTVVEGPVQKRKASTEGGDVYYIKSGRKTYRCDREVHERMPDKRNVRLFVLPRAGFVVSYEVLGEGPPSPPRLR
jgi:hypothetical protein